MQPLSLNKQTTPTITKINDITTGTLETNLLNCFLKQYGNKENLRVQRTINSLNTQIQKLKIEESPNKKPPSHKNYTECITPKSDQKIQYEKLKTQAQPLNTIQKKLEAIERCMVNGFSLRKTKRQQMNRQEWRQKATSVYQQDQVMDQKTETDDKSTPSKMDGFMPFQFYQFRDSQTDSNVIQTDNFNEKETQDVNRLNLQLRQVNLEKDDLIDQIKELKREAIRYKETIIAIQSSQDTVLFEQRRVFDLQQEQFILDQEKLELSMSDFQIKLQSLDKREIEVKIQKAQNARDLDTQHAIIKQIEQDRECQVTERQNIDCIQSKINNNIQQILQLNREDLQNRVSQQVGIQLEAYETLVEATKNERLHLEKKAQYIQQLREIIDEEKTELLILRRNFV